MRVQLWLSKKTFLWDNIPDHDNEVDLNTGSNIIKLNDQESFDIFVREIFTKHGLCYSYEFKKNISLADTFRFVQVWSEEGKEAVLLAVLSADELWVFWLYVDRDFFKFDRKAHTTDVLYITDRTHSLHK